jgi:hypothetical protein
MAKEVREHINTEKHGKKSDGTYKHSKTWRKRLGNL